ncbi:hypothetical protein Theam_0062 [Thermovibrio ammonificans HB-1]|uniref:Uncharacterized protein n=1 Tax=Thermovibrio ammonificans (strain DSM 15698 / JCM 12110 / HB-1) TaxID=648996 RepID=E8T331_THEA1|nr:hypothetical protein [Thermovibrio ammonificans]ADU96036.1 hypothetical protein Theam_0062 [Thermovibrio ammonificans HB-1]
MATLEEVLAALNAAGMDAREVLSKLPEIATTNGDVPFTFSDGTQIALPGLPKLKAEVDGFINDAEATIKEWWNRTLYVHPDGDDNAPGTEDAPFASPAKALSAIPNGGCGRIFVMGDFTIDDVSLLSAKRDNITVVFDRYPGLDANPKITLNNVRNFLYGSGNKLWFRWVDTEINASGFTAPIGSLFQWATHIFAGEAGNSMLNTLGFWGCNININVDSDYYVYLGSSEFVMRFYQTQINYNNSTGNNLFKLCDARNTNILRFTDTVITCNGTQITDLAGLIANLVRDANGIPRNITSNLIL